MSSRFPHQRTNLFADFDAPTNAPPSRKISTSPRPGSYAPNSYSPSYTNGHASYGYSSPADGSSSTRDQLFANGAGKYRAATPNRKGQYSDAVLNELEGQNERELEGMSGRVAMLKQLTTAIGEEIRDSSALADKMNESFSNTRVRLQGTMNRMLRMAEKTGVGWRVWLGFFAAVILLFWWVRVS
ncbi:MAG: hypothetical protein Q9159_006283 [Coniocarpon cinnabarinum]